MHDAEASTSRAMPPTSDAAPSRLEQELHRRGVPQGPLDEARAERTLWQEFRAQRASLNAALTETLWLHGGRSFQIFEVRVFVGLALFTRPLSHPDVFQSDFFFCFLVCCL
jgi:hypothetical protein